MRNPSFMLPGLLLGLAAAPACAQVMEIRDDGSVVQIGGGWSQPAAEAAAPGPYRDAIQAAARTYDLSPDLIEAVARTESALDPSARSTAGAVGIMQLMPATARSLGVDPADPVQNIMGGARYLRDQLDAFGGAVDLALAAYNAGPSRVARAGGVPAIPETQAYVGRNLDRLARMVDSQGTDR